jgi:hypothetical protein
VKYANVWAASADVCCVPRLRGVNARGRERRDADQRTFGATIFSDLLEPLVELADSVGKGL